MQGRSILVAVWLLSACQKEPKPPQPDDIVRQFVAAMTQAHGTPAAGQRVVDLMWEPARQNLQERADRASALSGRELLPRELIAPSWFALHMVPEAYESRIEGSWAEVTVIGRSGERVHVRCRKESEEWKVAVDLPALAPIRQRQLGE